MTQTQTQDVLICGSIAFDTIAVFEGRFRDHILADNLKSLSVSFFVPSLRKEFGGCAGNIAYNLKLLGGHPVPVGAIGQDAEDYLQRLRDLGIDTSLVRVVPDTYTAQCYITTDLDNSQIASFHPGAMLHSAENDLTGHDARWAIVSPDAKDGMFVHAERLKAAGIPFVFDLGQAMPLFDGDDLRRMIAMAAVLTANDYEASVIEDRLGRKMPEIAAGLRAAVVTRGAEGATLYTGGEQVHIPTAPVARVVDPTGCGDAHRAGLLYGLVNDWSLRDACCLANVMGGFKVASQGPQNHAPTRAEIAAVLRLHYGIDAGKLA
ncbi:carbohydrate kinase family protein [Castellaniella caeni]